MKIKEYFKALKKTAVKSCKLISSASGNLLTGQVQFVNTSLKECNYCSWHVG